MIFTGLILLIVGLSVFFHYIQGFFSATISAIIAVFAAVMAFSYHETLAGLLGGKAADYSYSLCLLALYGLTYLILRLVFDKFVTGNLRLPLIADKVGAVVMGLVAGIFAAGIVAIAGQELPFAANIGNFTRFDTQPKREVILSYKGRGFHTDVWDELNTSTPGSMGDAPHGVTGIPVDDIVVGTVSKLSSETGSLSNGRPLEQLHPDFLSEIFGQRLGIEPSASRVAVNSTSPRVEAIKVVGLFTIDPKIAQSESEMTPRYGNWLKPIVLNGSEMFLVIRFTPAQAAADSDNFVRFSPGASRLLVHDPQAQPGDDYKNYYPVGAMFGTDKLLLNKVDDFLYAGVGKDVDLVYKVPKKLFDKQGPEGAIFEFKRMARVSLEGMKVSPTLPDDGDNAGLFRKTYIEHPDQNPDNQNNAPPPSLTVPVTPAPATGTPSGSTGAAGTAFNAASVTASKKLPVPFGVAANTDATALMQLPENGNVKLQDEQLKTVVVDAPVAQLTGPRQVTEFSVPNGTVMIQVDGTPASNALWNFTTEPEQYEIVDSKGTHYAPNGVMASYKGAAGDHLLMRYIDQTTISGADAPKATDPPTKVVMFFNVPAGSAIVEFDDHGQKSKPINVQAK